jgi:oligoendopeptidase F
VGAAAWNRLFDETMAGLMFTVAGEEEPLNLEATLNLLTDADRDGARRRRARWPRCSTATSSCSPRPQHAGQGKGNHDRWRKMPTPQTGRHLSNHVEPEVVEALRNAVVAAYPKLCRTATTAQGAVDGAGQAAGLGPQRPPAHRGAAHWWTGTRRPRP